MRDEQREAIPGSAQDDAAGAVGAATGQEGVMGCGIAKMLVVAVLVADIVSPRTVEIKPPDTKAVEAWEAPAATAPPQTAPVWQDKFVPYRVNDVSPPHEWQWYLYGQLADRGISWFYPHAICQIYQESNWNRWADNGRGDLGLTQQKAVYWADRAAQAGIPGADIWEPYAQLFVYAWQIANYLTASGDKRSDLHNSR